MPRACHPARPVRPFAAAALALLSAAAAAAPRIEATQTTHAFGWRDAAETVTNRFTLRNTGNATLLLSEIRTTCGCSRAEPERRALAPGEETSLEVRTALPGLNGKIRKSVTVVSNDPDTPFLALWVEGEARAAVCLEPSSLAFGRLNPDRMPPPETVRLAGYITNATIKAVMTDNPAYRVTPSPDGRALTVVPPQPSAPGACRGVVRVTLSDPSLPTLALPLYAWVDDLLRIAPSALAFRPSDKPATTRLVVVRPGKAPRFRITGVAIKGGSGQARAVSRPDGSYQVVLEGVVPDTLATNAALAVSTDLAEHPEWLVPLRVEGQRAP